jgi:hypothetical protein
MSAMEIAERERKRRWVLGTAASLGVGLSVLVAAVWDSPNPCQEVHARLCAEAPGGFGCVSSRTLAELSVSAPSAKVREDLRLQCESRLSRLKDERTLTSR